MPQMRFRVRWPDGTVMSCYSPSLVIKDYFNVGQSYGVTDFVARSGESLTIAGERVKAKFGFYCTGAADQLEAIVARAAEFDQLPDARVTIEGFEE
jgi:uncharacterized repeat protein (TIGR04042 family)